MKVLMLTGVLAFALALSAVAQAGATTYAGASQWWPGMGFGSSYSSSWWRNVFYKPSGFDTTVTFIDNVSYGWHATVRSKGTQTTETNWFSSQVKRAHCVANVNGAYGTCTAYN